jgi:hypothetical protein
MPLLVTGNDQYQLKASGGQPLHVTLAVKDARTRT